MRNLFLKFSTDNAKLEKSGLIVHTFSIPSGITCPGACECKAHFDLKKKKLIDGPKQKYRCFSASQEAMFPSLRKARHHNLNILLKDGGATVDGLYNILEEDLPTNLRTGRIHVGGDMYSQAYFDAWVRVAGNHANKKFYAYTKSLPFWIERLGQIPVNLVLTASRGGKFDCLIEPYKLKQAIVVDHPEEAAALGIEIDHDDTMAMTDDIRIVALKLHGTQPAGSGASKALKRMRDEGIPYSYARPKKGVAA